MTDYYQTLGIQRDAGPDEIKKAYRKMAAQHHPDKGGDTAKFQEVQKAYETLSDPQKKQAYDNPNPFGARGAPDGFNFGQGFPGGFQFNFNGFNINDIFGTAFGHGFQQPQPPSYKTVVNVTLEQAYTGDEQTLQFNINGQRQLIKIQVPKGVLDGQTLRYDNLIKNAVLIVEFRITPHNKFERDNANLYTIHDVDVLDLIVGSTFSFTTVSGKVLTVRIPAKTQPGHKLRLAGEGMPNKNGFGDQFILLKPYIPDNIDSRITDSILQFKNK